jgi:hypothetical protein
MDVVELPQSRAVRPFLEGDIVSFPYLNAIGHYTGRLLEGTEGGIEATFEWCVAPGGPCSVGHLPTRDDTDAHGYATVENSLTGSVAIDAVEGVARIDLDKDRDRDLSRV